MPLLPQPSVGSNAAIPESKGKRIFALRLMRIKTLDEFRVINDVNIPRIILADDNPFQ